MAQPVTPATMVPTVRISDKMTQAIKVLQEPDSSSGDCSDACNTIATGVTTADMAKQVGAAGAVDAIVRALVQYITKPDLVASASKAFAVLMQASENQHLAIGANAAVKFLDTINVFEAPYNPRVLNAVLTAIDALCLKSVENAEIVSRNGAGHMANALVEHEKDRAMFELLCKLLNDLVQSSFCRQTLQSIITPGSRPYNVLSSHASSGPSGIPSAAALMSTLGNTSSSSGGGGGVGGAPKARSGFASLFSRAKHTTG